MSRPIIGITTDIKGEHLRMKHYYSDAVLKAGGVPVLIPPSDHPGIYAERISGLLIPGGYDLDPSYYHEETVPQVKLASRKRSDFEMALLREMIYLTKPVLGICYGMQLINVFFGGTLYQDISAQANVAIDHKKGYHLIVITENRFLRKGRFSVNGTHHQAIKKLGIGLSVFASSADNLIEGLYKEGYHFLVGVQWHPERQLKRDISWDLFQSFIKAVDDGK